MEKLAADIGKLRSVLCPTSPVAAKKNYPMPENRIVRRFAPFRELQEHFFLNLHAENMLKVCEKVRPVMGRASRWSSWRPWPAVRDTIPCCTG